MPALNVVSIVYAARRDDGYVVSDFKRYRNRCAHRIAHYRHAVGVKSIFYRDENDLPEEHRSPSAYENLLLLVLFEAERALGEAMQAHQAMQTDALYSKMRRRIFTRLHRTVERASVVETLGKKGYAVYASCLFYMHYVRGVLRHEREDYTAAASDFDVAKALLDKMKAAPGADLAGLQFFSDEIEKRRNYCIYMVSAFVDDPVVAKLLDNERSQIVAETIAGLATADDMEFGAALDLCFLTGRTSLARPQGPLSKRLEPLLEARSSIGDPSSIVCELLSGYEAFYGCATQFYFGSKDEALRKTLSEVSIGLKTAGKKLAIYKVWLARFRTLCLVYREKTGSFDKPRLDAILRVLNGEMRLLKLISGLTMVIYRLVYFQEEIFLIDTDTAPAVSLGSLPLKGKGALTLIIETIAVLEGMTAPTHRAIHALNATNDPLLALLLALHSFESALFLCNKHQEDVSGDAENNKLKKDLLRQASSRFSQLSAASATVKPDLIQSKITELGCLFPGLVSLLVGVLKNDKLFSNIATLSTNRLIVLMVEAQKRMDPAVFQLYGLLPPPYTEDMVPDLLVPDFIMNSSVDEPERESNKEVVEKADAPKKKRFFGLF
ncbi:Signal recognition particle 68 kd protein [Giardia duodenalis]|uniref:Signal recognition particle subunit SRP68 n=1 Tax=Giardia intestinalis TaxID=5741 RepID=V6TBS8_GIAIN|nr:Signal recognition particle 68 kd protein [Giardia intestinalis]